MIKIGPSFVKVGRPGYESASEISGLRIETKLVISRAANILTGKELEGAE
jgi:hypothetical protein